MFNFSNKLKKAGKVALASLLVSATMLSAVGCDLISNLQASVEDQIQETNTNGNPITQTEEFTYPEIETEKYQTFSLEKIGLDCFTRFKIGKALEGLYLEQFNINVVNISKDMSVEGTKYYNKMYKNYGDKAEEYISIQQAVAKELNEQLTNENKNFTFSFNLVNDVYHTYYLSVNDELGIFALSCKDNYTQEVKILDGIIGGNFYSTDTNMSFIKESDKDKITTYLSSHSFNEFTTNMLAYVPSLYMPTQIMTYIQLDETRKLLSTEVAKGTYNYYEDKKPGERLKTVMLNFELDASNKIVGVNFFSSGTTIYNKEDSTATNIAINAGIITATVHQGLTQEIVKQALEGNYEQEAQPEAE